MGPASVLNSATALAARNRSGQDSPPQRTPDQVGRLALNPGQPANLLPNLDRNKCATWASPVGPRCSSRFTVVSTSPSARWAVPVGSFAGSGRGAVRCHDFCPLHSCAKLIAHKFRLSNSPYAVLHRHQPPSTTLATCFGLSPCVARNVACRFEVLWIEVCCGVFP